MKATRQSTWVMVSVDGDETREFNRHWPCSEIPNGCTLLIELDARNGDLVNITTHLEDGQYIDAAEIDGTALLAMCNDANNFAVGAGLLPQWTKR
jgi:hypothetical protein